MSLARPSAKSTENRFYVEGADDFHVVCALVRKSGVTWNPADSRIPYAPATNGDTDAIGKAVVAMKARTPRVGLVVDGDDHPTTRWGTIRRQFKEIDVVLAADYPNDAQRWGRRTARR